MDCGFLATYGGDGVVDYVLAVDMFCVESP
jgi:hypothetical protein